MTPASDNIDRSSMTGASYGGAAIESLFALHEHDVSSALRRVLGRSEGEDDLVQETFIRLVVRCRQPGVLCFEAWLRGVVHNLAVDEIRRRRHVPVEEFRLDREVNSLAHDALVGSELLCKHGGSRPEAA